MSEVKAEILETATQPREGETPPTTTAAGPADSAVTGPMSPQPSKDGALLPPNQNLKTDQYAKQYADVMVSGFIFYWSDCMLGRVVHFTIIS